MGLKISLKYVAPKKTLSDMVNRFETELDKTLTLTAADIQIDFIKTINTWNNRPAFKIKFKPYSREISTDSKIYGYINKGTPVRFAYMSTDFVAKSAPNSLGSMPGAGKKWGINRNNPRPGIKARNFDKLIVKKYAKQFPKDIEKLLKMFSK